MKTKKKVSKKVSSSLFMILLSMILVMATVYNVNGIPSFEPTSPLNASTVPNHFTLLNVTVNVTGNLDIKIFANSNRSRLNLKDSLVFHTLNATQNISYDLTTIPIQPDDEGLILLYHFDNLSEFGENATLVYDFAGSGGINNGTVTGATWNESGKMGGTYDFGEGNNYIQNTNVNYLLNTTTNFTVSAWINPAGETPTGIGEIIYLTRGEVNGLLELRYTANRRMECGLKNDTASFLSSESVIIPLNNWSFVTCVAVSDGTALKEVKLYINGVLDNNVSGTVSGYGGNANIIRIGMQKIAPNRFFNGTIDEVAIYNRSLNSTEIKNLYNLQIEKYYWKVNATDISGNSNESDIWEFNAAHSQIAANFSSSIGNIRSYFYGVNHAIRYISNNSWLDKDADGTLDTNTDYIWQRDRLQDAGINYLRDDMGLEFVANEDGSFDTTTTTNLDNINVQKNVVEWAKENNIKVLFIASYMPDWLKNNTEGWCASSQTKCPPSNYTRWGELVVDYLQAVDCDADTCEVVVWNEPDLAQFWMPDVAVTNINRSIEYNKLYNATYDAIKTEYPDMQVGGPSTTGTDANTNLIMLNWMSNFTDKIDFVSHHDYLGQGDFTDFDLAVRDDYDWIFSNISSRGVDTSRIILEEFNVWSAETKVNQTDEWGIQLALAYSGTLNSYPENITIIQYQWAETLNYTEGSANYPEHPQRWTMLAEPELENEFYRSYNVTKSFATYHSAGSTMYESSSDNNDVKVVSSKNGDDFFITIINTDSEKVNVTLNTDGAFTGIKDLETGGILISETGVFELGIMDSFEILYLGSEPCEFAASGDTCICSTNDILNDDGLTCDTLLEASNICGSLSLGIDNVSSKIPIIFTIIGVVLILGVLSLLIVAWQGGGVGNLELDFNIVLPIVMGVAGLIIVSIIALTITSTMCSI